MRLYTIGEEWERVNDNETQTDKTDMSYQRDLGVLRGDT